jgi:hypothetical protein
MIQREYKWASGKDYYGDVIEEMNHLGGMGFEFVQFDDEGNALMEREREVLSPSGRAVRQQVLGGPRYDRIPEIVRLPCTKEHTHHDADTMVKVREAIQDSLVKNRNNIEEMSCSELAFDAIREMQNAGILFRERM